MYQMCVFEFFIMKSKNQKVDNAEPEGFVYTVVAVIRKN